MGNGLKQKMARLLVFLLLPWWGEGKNRLHVLEIEDWIEIRYYTIVFHERVFFGFNQANELWASIKAGLSIINGHQETEKKTWFVVRFHFFLDLSPKWTNVYWKVEITTWSLYDISNYIEIFFGTHTADFVGNLKSSCEG